MATSGAAARAAILAFLVAACVGPAAPLARPTETPVRGGEFVELVTEDFTNLQPVGNTATQAHRAWSLIYERLIDMDPVTGQPRSRLATWQQSADGRTIDFRIARDAVWSDGREIIADDLLTFFRAVRASNKVNRNQKLAPSRIEGLTDFHAGRASEISGITVDKTDPKRFSVRLTGGACTAIWFFLARPLLPAHVFGKYLDPSAGDAIDRASENDAPPVASGPFVFAEWRRGERLRLVRNERYFRGAPLLDAYVFKIVPSAESWVEHLRRATADYIPIRGQLGVDAQRDALEGRGVDPRLRVLSSVQGDYTFIGWNTQSASAPALRDRRIRQALAYGLDGTLALSQIYGGTGTRMDSHHAPGHWAHPSGLEPYDYDPARARDLIESAGYRLGADGVYRLGDRELAFTLKTNAGNKQREALAQFALDQYRKLGVRVTVQIVQFRDLVNEFQDRDTIEAFVLGWALDEPDDPYSIWHSVNVSGPGRSGTGLNGVRFVRPEVDAALERARDGPECSIPARQREYATFNKILNEEQPYYFGFTLLNVRAVTAKLRGFEPGTFSHSCCLDLHDVHKWWFAK